jgi:hypothetical protein
MFIKTISFAIEIIKYLQKSRNFYAVTIGQTLETTVGVNIYDAKRCTKAVQ